MYIAPAWVSCLLPIHKCVGAASVTSIGVGVGVGALLMSVLTLVAIILVVVVVKRKVTYKQKGDSKMEDTPSYSNELTALQGNELVEKRVDANKGSFVDGFDPYEDVDCKVQIKTAMKQAPKESSTPVSVTNIGDLYAVVDKSQKKGSKKEKETTTSKEGLYAMPVKKKGKLTERGEGVVESGGVEKEEENDDMVGVKNTPKADSESAHQIEEDSKALNVEMLYAVVDKSHKKRK